MRIVIDIIFCVMLLLCAYLGYRRGLINALIVAVSVLAAFAGALYLGTLVPEDATIAIKPFASGFVQSQCEEAALKELGFENDSVSDAIAGNEKLTADYSTQCYKELGFYNERAYALGESTGVYSVKNDVEPTQAVVEMLCHVIGMLLGGALAFIIILLFISFIKNLFNLRFRITDNAGLDRTGGVIFGLAEGIICCLILCWILSFCGIIIGKTVLDDSLLGRFFLLLTRAADIVL